MKSKQSKLVTNLPTKTHKPSQTNRLILLISFFLGSIPVGYFTWCQIQLNAAQKLVDDCSLDKNCDQIISALEKLVNAQKNLRSLNLSHANLSPANLSKRACLKNRRMSQET